LGSNGPTGSFIIFFGGGVVVGVVMDSKLDDSW
jgi:hypothetical protein